MTNLESPTRLMDFKVRLGASLRQAMRLRRFSQRQVGEHMGVHQTQVGKWIRGVNTPGVEQLCRLASLLDVPISSLLGQATGATPGPDLTDDERAVIDLMRALGLTKSVALRRLATPHPDEAIADAELQVARPIGVVDLSGLPPPPTIRPILEGQPEGKREPAKPSNPPFTGRRRRSRS